MGIIAANGYAEVQVYEEPSIAVISTGDELVDLGDFPQDHQIRRSNPYALKAELNCFQFNRVDLFHLHDDRAELFSELKKILEQYDILVLSGGVSAGKYDFLPQIFADLGVKEIFHKVSQRPGKPFWFGSKVEKLVFALPGNPVSAVTCLRRYVVPALLEMRPGENHVEVYGTLTEGLYL
jgi:molybdopterin molybdotransferase